jgi:ATP-dependent helicase/nuclease subunit B
MPLERVTERRYLWTGGPLEREHQLFKAEQPLWFRLYPSLDARFARDAYLLACLIHSGSRVILGTSRFRSQGEPNRPSRLLFACGDAELPRRSRRLLRPSLPAKRQETKASWTLELPLLIKAVEAMRVTGFKNYLQCPLRFYLQNVCGIRDFDPEAREISPRDFGTVMHKVLEEYGANEATKHLEDPAEIARVFDRKLDEVARRFYGDLFSPVVLVQLESMRARLRSLAPWQARARADGWRIRDYRRKRMAVRLGIPAGASVAAALGVGVALGVVLTRRRADRRSP